MALNSASHSHAKRFLNHPVRFASGIFAKRAVMMVSIVLSSSLGCSNFGFADSPAKEQPTSPAKVQPTSAAQVQPSSPAKVQHESSAKVKVPSASQSVTVIFPEQAVGKIFKVEILKNGLIVKPNVATEYIKARGKVELDPKQPISFVLNYAGSENPSFFDGIGALNVIILDMNNLENVDDNTLKHVVHLVHLRRIFMNSTDVTDQGLASLQGMSKLNSISACGTLLKGTGFSYLKKLPNLEIMEMARSDMKHAKLDDLAEFPRLKMLDLSGCVIDDKACVNIGKIQTLTNLTLAKNGITNGGVRSLANLKNLLELNLQDTAINGDAAASFKLMPKLEHLMISQSQLAQSAVDRLKLTLPKCRIELRTNDQRLDKNLFSPLK